MSRFSDFFVQRLLNQSLKMHFHAVVQTQKAVLLIATLILPKSLVLSRGLTKLKSRVSLLPKKNKKTKPRTFLSPAPIAVCQTSPPHCPPWGIKNLLLTPPNRTYNPMRPSPAPNHDPVWRRVGDKGVSEDHCEYHGGKRERERGKMLCPPPAPAPPPPTLPSSRSPFQEELTLG